MINRKSSKGNVILRANDRVARFAVLDISQKMSSASTAESPMLVEKMMLASDRPFGRMYFHNEAFDRVTTSGDRVPVWGAFEFPWPDNIGNSFCETTNAMIKKVRRKGSADMATVIGLRCGY